MTDTSARDRRIQDDQHPWRDYKKFDASNSSEGQETFVLNVLDEKRNGYFVEIGSNHPFTTNNTALLEKEYGWTGVALEVDKKYVDMYNELRESPCVQHDAMTFDYLSYFKENNFPKQIDYLQIDIDIRPRNANLLALIQLPLSTYRFSVITLEHCLVTEYDLEPLRAAQRLILSSYGYRLVVQGDNEDWWVDPEAVKPENYWALYSIGNLRF